MAKEARARKGLWQGMFHPDNEKVKEEIRATGAPSVKTLWGQEFNLVQGGLEEAQVVAYVEGLNSRHSSAMEKLHQPQSLSEIAGKVLFEAEKLAENVGVDARKRAAEQAAEIILRAEERAEEIIDETEIDSARRLQEVTRLSAKIVEEVGRRTALAKEVALQQVPQQVASIQANLQAAIDQAYHKVLEDLMVLESEIKSTETEEWLQLAETSQVEGASEEAHWEGEAKGRLLGVSGGPILAPGPEEHQVSAKEGEAPLELSGSTGHGLSDSRGGTVEEVDYANLSRDEVREKILESLQEAVGLNGHREAWAPKEAAKTDEEQTSPNPASDSVAVNGNGEASKESSNMYAGDLELIMAPQRDRGEAKNHLARLSALYMAVKKVPGASVLGTGGSEAGGNSIAVHFESPVCLDEVLKGVKMWEEERPGNGAIGPQVLLGRLKSGKGAGDLQWKRILVTL